MKNLIYVLIFLPISFLSGCVGSIEESEEEPVEQVGDDGTEANRLAEIKVKDTPPKISVSAGGETVEPILGSYSWSVENNDGTVNSIEVDSDTPPELVKRNDPLLITDESLYSLSLPEEPINMEIRIWMNETDFIFPEDLDSSFEGELTYEILIDWEQGKASYAFLAYRE